MCVSQDKQLLSYKWNICVYVISKGRDATCMLHFPQVLLHSFLFVHSSFFLQVLLAACRWYAVFWSFCVPSSSVFELFFFCWMSFIRVWFSIFVVIPTIQIPQLFLMILFLMQSKMKVWWCLRLVLNWIQSQRLLWPQSDLNQKAIQHTCIVYPAVLR